MAALSDKHPEYAGSCGACYEVKCQNNGFKDGYGNWIDRKGALLVLMVVVVLLHCVWRADDRALKLLSQHQRLLLTTPIAVCRWLHSRVCDAGMCKDSEASVVVTVTDTCPCMYSNNFYRYLKCFVHRGSPFGS